ncbi:TetR/AcrR family transcriptional regulator [Nonomuraea pusilla]|uniref:Transcriptional regulator, TetR family n=1 Tax=Nonomuraea pusilla TaxID=46177 RepID=A0A1H7LRH7_9ACTN|nr:TetR/AcrR family transcriptional regulator [Nonomuraea pusilla]SEL01572.1 transcriptional regulator, TetR family [Nonomuraea pusilla]
MERRRPIWLREEEPARRPRLSRERIVAAAVELLDAEGVEGFSMRALAARLRAGTMSLYEYVTGKEDVLDLALDAAIGEIELDGDDAGGDPREGWREDLVLQLSRGRRVMLRHPWMPALAATRPLLGPNALARSERVYSVLARAGLSGADLTAAVGALSFYVNGYVAAEHTWWSRLRTRDADAELRDEVRRHLEDRPERYPTLAGRPVVTDGDFDAQFVLGLSFVLDGVAARLPGPGPA